MQKKYERNRDKLVLVRKKCIREGHVVEQTQWVAGDNVHPDDEVVQNAHNVRPYRYSATPNATVTCCADTGSPLGTRSASLFARILAGTKH